MSDFNQQIRPRDEDDASQISNPISIKSFATTANNQTFTKQDSDAKSDNTDELIKTASSFSKNFPPPPAGVQPNDTLEDIKSVSDSSGSHKSSRSRASRSKSRVSSKSSEVSNPYSNRNYMNQLRRDSSFSTTSSYSGTSDLERALNHYRNNNDSYLHRNNQSLHETLNDDENKEIFNAISLSNLFNQKRQMQILNKELNRYMTENTKMDHEIDEMEAKCKDQAKEQDDKKKGDSDLIKKSVAEIVQRKTQVNKDLDQVKKQREANEMLRLGNKILREDCEDTEQELEFLKAKIAKVDARIHAVNMQLEDETRQIDDNLDPEKEKLEESYKALKRNNAVKIERLVRAHLIMDGDSAEEMVKKSFDDNKTGMNEVLKHYRNKIAKEKSDKFKEELEKMNKQVDIAEAHEKQLEDKISDMKKTEEKLSRDLDEKKADVQMAEYRVDECQNRVERAQNWHDQDLEKLAFKMDRSEKLKDLLGNDYERACKYLSKVLLKEAGEKDRLDDELKKMAVLLKAAENNGSKYAFNQRSAVNSRRQSLKSPIGSSRTSSRASSRISGSRK